MCESVLVCVCVRVCVCVCVRVRVLCMERGWLSDPCGDVDLPLGLSDAGSAGNSAQ